MNKTIIAIVGPTASGKTSLSLKIAKQFGFPIIVADSRAIYREMNIATAKPHCVHRDNEVFVDGVQHFCLDQFSPKSLLSLYEWKGYAEKALEKVFRNNDLVIISGGTGLYIDALLKGFNLVPNRIKMDEYSPHEYREMIAAIDSTVLEKIDSNNPRRLKRAYEVISQGINFEDGMRMQNPRKEKVYWFGLETDRDKLYNQIDNRVDVMIKDGLEGEFEKLYNSYHLFLKSPLYATIGYQELILAKNGEMTRDEAIDLIKKNSRHYAKRQITWFRKNNKITWGDSDNLYTTISDVVRSVL